MRHGPVALLMFALLGAAGCSKPPSDPLQLDRGILDVTNTTGDNWTGVEIWINQQFRVTVPLIEAGSRFQVPLGSFVEGYGHRFEFNRMQVKELRLTAKKPDGSPVDIRMPMQKGGLSGVLGGKQ